MGTSGYLLSSFLAGAAIRRLGIGRVLVVSCLLATTALAGNALAWAWWWMVGMAFIGGMAGGAIDSGINTFAAARFSARVVNWLHAFWGVGATTGPLLVTAVLEADLSWRAGYGILAAVLALLTVLFVATLPMWTLSVGIPAGPPAESAPIGEALRHPGVMLHAILFFVYAGVETTAGQLLYSLLTEARRVDETVAGVVVGAYWAALTAGRIVFGQLAARMRREVVLRMGMLLAPVGVLMLSSRSMPIVSYAGAVLLGFAISPIFPTLISVTPRRVGERLAPHAVGFQIAGAAVGVATLPGLVGLAARRYGLEVLCAELLAATLLLLVLHESMMARYDAPKGSTGRRGRA
jgi:fucose permease